METSVNDSMKRRSALCIVCFLVLSRAGCSKEGDVLWRDDADTFAGDTVTDTVTGVDINAEVDGDTAVDTDEDFDSDVGTENGSVCTSDTDCEILSNCCYCVAVPRGTIPETCTLSCLPEYTSCLTLGVEISDATCWNGRCQLPDTHGNCYLTDITCNSAVPYCPGGYLPTELGNCWSVCIEGEACLWK